MLRHIDDTETMLASAVERNARVIVALRHAIAEVHVTHVDAAKPWQCCREEVCMRAALCLGETRSA